MASLKQLHAIGARITVVDFHDRKVMASLKRFYKRWLYNRVKYFHDRKVMASLKPCRSFGTPKSRLISMIERSWPH